MYLRKALIGILTLLEIIVILIIPTQISADVSNASVTAGNLLPFPQSIACDSTTKSLSSNTTVALSCWVVINDSNGYQNIDGLADASRAVQMELLNATENWNMAIYSSDAPYTRSRYYNSSCAVVASACSTGYTCTYNCSFKIWYNTWGSASADWQIMINITDESGGNSQWALNRTSYVTIQTLNAYSFTGEANNAITFGSVNPGAQSAEQTTPFWNTGNIVLDSQTNASADMTCQYGSINITNIRYNTTASSGWTIMAPMDYSQSNTHAILYTNFDLAPSTDYSAPVDPSSKDIYWVLNVPSGAGGTCWASIEVGSKT